MTKTKTGMIQYIRTILKWANLKHRRNFIHFLLQKSYAFKCNISLKMFIENYTILPNFSTFQLNRTKPNMEEDSQKLCNCIYVLYFMISKNKWSIWRIHNLAIGFVKGLIGGVMVSVVASYGKSCFRVPFRSNHWLEHWYVLFLS